MKTIETVYNKLNSNKTELATHKVELSNIKELEALISGGKDDSSDMVDRFLDAKQNCKKGIKAAENHLKNLKKINNVLNDIKQIADDLGVNVGTIKEYKKGFDFINGNPEGATKNMIKKMQSIL
tara:strand:- start:137 stop:508 length:372 start_codon:yes stop_codon:yes gene_type:complete